MSVWTRLEDWILALQKDRARAARYFLWAWWVSTAFVAVGFAIIFAVWTGLWRP